jgi:hypothetical protein
MIFQGKPLTEAAGAALTFPAEENIDAPCKLRPSSPTTFESTAK